MMEWLVFVLLLLLFDLKAKETFIIGVRIAKLNSSYSIVQLHNLVPLCLGFLVC